MMFGLNTTTALLGAGAIAASILLWLLLRSTKREAEAAAVTGLDADAIKATQAAAAEVTRETSQEDIDNALKNGTF